MTPKFSTIRRFFILLAVVWFAGYVSATTVCANSCPDCVSVSLNSCSASCSAVSLPTAVAAKTKFLQEDVQRAEFALIYVSAYTADIWKPPKLGAPSYRF